MKHYTTTTQPQREGKPNKPHRVRNIPRLPANECVQKAAKAHADAGCSVVRWSKLDFRGLLHMMSTKVLYSVWPSSLFWAFCYWFIMQNLQNLGWIAWRIVHNIMETQCEHAERVFHINEPILKQQSITDRPQRWWSRILDTGSES